MRELAFEAAKWSPRVLEASEAIIASKTWLTLSISGRDEVG